MKIEAIKTNNNLCFDLSDLQYFCDLKTLLIKDYESHNLLSISRFFTNFNSSNISFTLQHIFIHFCYMELDKEDEETFIQLCNTIKVPFGCRVYFKIESGECYDKKYIIYNLQDDDFVNCNGATYSPRNREKDEYSLFKDIYNSVCSEISKNNKFHVKNNLTQLIEIHKFMH